MAGEELAERFGVDYAHRFAGAGAGDDSVEKEKTAFAPRFNIAPTQAVIVVGDDGPW